MPYTVHFDKAIGCVMVVIDGELDLLLLGSTAADVATIINGRGCRRIANDLRNAQPANGALEIYYMPGTDQEAAVDYQYQRAIVVGDRASECYFLKTVFVNRGRLVKRFSNLDKAKEWLRSSQESARTDKTA